MATAITFLVNFLTDRGREFASMYVCVSVGITLIMPLASSFSRRDSLPMECCFPVRERISDLRRKKEDGEKVACATRNDKYVPNRMEAKTLVVPD